MIRSSARRAAKMEKRSLIAFALALGVLALYPVVIQKVYPDAYKNKQHAVGKTVPGSAAFSGAATSRSSESGTPALTDAASLAGILEPADDVVFTDKKLRVTFNKKGGAIRRIEFLDFKDSAGAPIRFFTQNSPVGAPTVIDVIGIGGATTIYNLTEGPDGVTVSVALSPALKVTKHTAFRADGYSADVNLTLENTSNEPLTFRYRFDVASRIPARESIDGQYVEANFYSQIDGKPSLRHIKEGKAGKSIESGAPVEWVAAKDRHFSVIVKPVSLVVFTGLVQGLGDRQFSASLVSASVTVPARSSVQHDFLLYAGPNDINKLLPLGLDPVVNFGKLDLIGKLLVGVLELYKGVFKSYGLAIILLTASINLLLFPFTRISYMSMKRMQLIQPQMTKLREQHKKSPEKLNKEMMELYKKHKVNPFGGCLPMLLQMPVFIALYVALSKTVGLRNASFFWIHDLSSPDSVTLPFSLPFLGNEIHVLPLIMVGAMVVQQRFTQIKMEGQDPSMEAQQKMMAVMMPILFGFIFYRMPSGLVLYWLTNTILMSAYQLRLKNVTLT
jgi:YidC/Oxa1 family membrane protein insertase